MAPQSQLPLVAPRNFILNLKVNCSKCESYIKRFLLKIPGVHSAWIDEKKGTVAISGTVDPSTVIMLLDKGLGRKAELLRDDQTPSSSTAATTTTDGQVLQIVAESTMVDERFNDPHVVAQLQQLSGIKGLKSVEVSYSKKIKLTYKGPNDDLNHDKNVQVIIQDEVHPPKIHRTTAGGRGLCAASTSCCGGHHHDHHVVNQNMINNEEVVCGCRARRNDHIHASPGYPIRSNNACAVHSCTCSSTNNGNMQWPPPPWSGGYSPSAPPIETGYYDAHARHPPPPPPPPPARDNSFFNQFNDENTSSSCNIM